MWCRSWSNSGCSPPRASTCSRTCRSVRELGYCLPLNPAYGLIANFRQAMLGLPLDYGLARRLVHGRPDAAARRLPVLPPRGAELRRHHLTVRADPPAQRCATWAGPPRSRATESMMVDSAIIVSISFIVYVYFLYFLILAGLARGPARPRITARCRTPDGDADHSGLQRGAIIRTSWRTAWPRISWGPPRDRCCLRRQR